MHARTRAALTALLALAALLLLAGPAAATVQAPPAPVETAAPVAPADTGTEQVDDGDSIRIQVGTGDDAGPTNGVLIILLLTVVSLAPAVLVLLTSFTRIIIVLSLTRNALGVQNIPPNQVLVGLALFLSLFLMGPVLAEVNEKGLQPYLAGEMSASEAYAAGQGPLREFMLEQTGQDELALFVRANGDGRPATPDDVEFTSLVPAFVLSEIKTAFLMGFVIFVPFLVIDLVVSSSLMSMGMMMLPPVLISLPFKLLLFVMVDGWALVVRSLLASYT